jgi:hypothetical protein
MLPAFSIEPHTTSIDFPCIIVLEALAPSGLEALHLTATQSRVLHQIYFPPKYDAC